MSQKYAIILSLLIVLSACTEVPLSKTYEPKTRIYYIAAENIEWDYAPNVHDVSKKELEEKPWLEQTKYNKTRYIEYSDETFTIKFAPL